MLTTPLADDLPPMCPVLGSGPLYLVFITVVYVLNSALDMGKITKHELNAGKISLELRDQSTWDKHGWMRIQRGGAVGLHCGG